MTNQAYELARAEVGVTEWASGHNPRVVQYFDDVGHAWVRDDETAWCAAFVGAMLKRAGMPHTGKLNARSYLDWGEPVDLSEARPGDIVVFWRGSRASWQGHVGFYVSASGSDIMVLGGNQANAVNVKPYATSRLLGVRRAPGSKPPTPVRLTPSEPRTRPSQSRTVRGSAAQLVTAVGGAVGALEALDGPAQLAALAICGAVGVLAAWIMRERLRKWAAGDR